ncbi:hypothetical protein WJX82_003049 [Trebouxia sp. C0006]
MKSKSSVELAGSGVTNIFPSTRRLQSGLPVPTLPLWLKGFAVSMYHQGRGWTPDKGSEKNEAFRKQTKEPSLVSTGKNAGASRVEWMQHYALVVHEWRRDFFHSSLSTHFGLVVAFICLVYTATFFLFGVFWWAELAEDNSCVENSNGLEGFANGHIMSVITAQTIGYGNTWPNECWQGAWLLIVHQVFAMIMNAVTVGIIFSRVSFPQQRGRTIAISDSAIIARRDGILKFMFRIADIRQTQVIAPRVKAYLYTWGPLRYTAEGDRIPAKIENLNIGYIDGMLLLPLVEEHNIDERSPLCGHTHQTLMSVAAEIVITFEGTTEFGNDFMARQSYLPNELRWGHCFKDMLGLPAPGTSQYRIDFSGFHEVLPLIGFEDLTQSQACQQTIHGDPSSIPYPLLNENTFVISSSMVLNHGTDREHPRLQFRVGDTYPNQHVGITVRALIYRWMDRDAAGVPQDYSVQPLEIGFASGQDRLLLWLPMTMTHVIDETSPLSNWKIPEDALQDADATIVILLEGYKYAGNDQKKDIRMRFFHTHQNIHPNHVFQPVVSPPTVDDRKPRVNWVDFHTVMPVDSMDTNHSGRLEALAGLWRTSGVSQRHSGTPYSNEHTMHSLPHSWRPGSFHASKAFPSDDSSIGNPRKGRTWLPFFAKQQQVAGMMGK